MSLEGMAVAEAVLENIEEGVATLVIPATRVQVQIRQSLDVAARPTPEVDRAFGGISETNDDTPSEATKEVNEVPVPAPAPVAEIGEGIHNQNLDSSAID